MKRDKEGSTSTRDTLGYFDAWKIYRDDQRVPLRETIILEGHDSAGRPFVEETVTENASREGMCVESTHELKPGVVLQVSAPYAGFRSQARVATVKPLKSPQGKFRVGLHFVKPSQDWIIR